MDIFEVLNQTIMADIILEQEKQVIAPEIIELKDKKNKIDDFFSSFEETIQKPVIFARPKEGEECEHCSA